MRATSVVGAFVGLILMLGGAGCAAGVDQADDDPAATSSELNLRPSDDLDTPSPVDYPIPVPPLGDQLGKWGGKRYFGSERHPGFDFDQCYQYIMKIFDPARGHDISVPVTVCS